MPVKSLRKMAKDAGVSLKDAERYWKEGKKSAKEQGFEEGDDDFYAYTMGIVKRRMGLFSIAEMVYDNKGKPCSPKGFGRKLHSLFNIGEKVTLVTPEGRVKGQLIGFVPRGYAVVELENGTTGTFPIGNQEMGQPFIEIPSQHFAAARLQTIHKV